MVLPVLDSVVVVVVIVVVCCCDRLLVRCCYVFYERVCTGVRNSEFVGCWSVGERLSSNGILQHM